MLSYRKMNAKHPPPCKDTREVKKFSQKAKEFVENEDEGEASQTPAGLGNDS